MNPRASKNIDWIDTAKGVCILLVVLHHVSITSNGYGIDNMTSIGAFFVKLYHYFGVYLSPLRMPLFFMISGFLVSRAATASDWRDVAQKRIYNIVYLFALWGSIQWVFVSVINMLGQPEVRLSTAVNAIYASSLTEFLYLMIKGSSSLWYLYALPIYFVLCKLLSRTPFLAMVLFFGFNLVSQHYLTQWPTGGIFGNVIYYGLGCFFGRYIFSVFSNFNVKLWGHLILVFGLAVCIKLVGLGASLAASIVAIAVAVILFSRLQEKFSMTWLSWLGKNTLQIYVIHRILIEVWGVVVLPFLVGHGLFENQMAATIWVALSPLAVTTLITAGAIAIWRATCGGWGQYLYSAPTVVLSVARAN